MVSYFALTLTIAGLQLYILNKYFPELIDISAFTVKGQEEEANKNLMFFLEYQSVLMMLYVPIYAFISRLVFFNIKKYNYTEHLVIFTYVLAEISIISSFLTIIGAFLGLNLGELGMIFLPLQIIYSAYCLKRLYSLSLLGIILRTLLFLALLFVLFIIVVIGAVAYLFLTRALGEMADDPKTALILYHLFLQKLDFV